MGKVYTREELQRLAEIAQQRDLLICSDEIHAGLVLNPEKQHIPIAALDESVAQRTITLMAPSKTWNVAGLSCSFAVIPNAELRQKFQQAMQDIVSDVNVLGLVAAEAAYRDGEPWRQALISYLRDNAALIQQTIDQTPGLSTTPVDATYLAWIDCRELGVDNPAMLFEQHGVGLSNGKDFGAPGFVRLNFGCSRALLKQGLARMQSADVVLVFRNDRSLDDVVNGKFTLGADAGQHLEHQVYMDHDAPHTRSRVNYKGALQGEGAHTVWIGDVLIRNSATGTDSYEQNRNLVLSEGTRADSIPNLEIETGDIAGAGHASATGRFDDEHIFYLRSRGISEEEARKLVVHGFLLEVIQQIGDAETEERLRSAVEAELAEAVRA